MTDQVSHPYRTTDIMIG